MSRGEGELEVIWILGLWGLQTQCVLECVASGRFGGFGDQDLWIKILGVYWGYIGVILGLYWG